MRRASYIVVPVWFERGARWLRMVRSGTLQSVWWSVLVRSHIFFRKRCGAHAYILVGFATTKGALIRSMLFPKPMGFKFYRDSVRFIGVLAGIAGLGFSASAVQFIHLGVPWHTILVRALDLITVVVPPALPATLSIGTSFAISRLRKQGIFCISPSRVNVAGKINVCCFDKTGTLTEDGLDILGIRGLDREGERFGELIDDVYDLPQTRGKANFHQALATCHSLKMVDGEPIGDPLDVKMFTFTKWTLEEGMNAGMGKIKGPSGMGQPAALVQTVVRPPGTGQFRLEDALRGGGRVCLFARRASASLNKHLARILPRTWRYPHFRVCFFPASDERHREEAQE